MKPSPLKETISFNDFEKLDIRVGTITSVSEVAKSKKLTVDLGDHTRSILAGIKKERANPQEIEGKLSIYLYFFDF